MNDQQLLHQFVTQHSQPAFRQLVERHTPWLYSVCLRRLRDPALAEDATQAIFLALAQKAPSLLREPTLSPWLHQVAKFVAANLLRAQTRRTRHESEAAAMTPITTTAPAWKDIEPDLEPALDRLPTSDRTMILLRFYEQKNHPEIAALLHISEAAAAKRLERALSRLRAHLAPTTTTTNLSTVTLAALLHTHTLLPTPATLMATTTVSTTTATLAKGALLAMATAKLQTAAVWGGVAAACLLISIPATLLIIHHDSPPPAPSAPSLAADPVSPPATAPDDFLAWYSLQPDEAFQLVTDAPIEARTAFLADGDPTRPPPPDTKYIIIRWSNDHPYLWGYGDTVPLFDILETYMGVYPQTLNIDLPLPPKTPKEYIAPDHALALPQLKGDFLIRADATPEQYRASLQSLLTKSLGHPVTLAFRDVTEKALVLRGSWNYTPHIPHAPAFAKRTPLLEIFGPTLDRNLNQGILANGPKDYIAGHLGAWLNQPVLIECDDFPTVSAHFNSEAINDPQSHDKTLILNHLAEQTGLTWSEETRTVRHLFIESALAAPENPLDLVTRIYGLKNDQFFALIHNAPAEAHVALYTYDHTERLTDPRYANYIETLRTYSVDVKWDGDTPLDWGVGAGARRPEDFASHMGLNSTQIEVNGPFPELRGDLVFRAGGTPEQYRASFETLLRNETHRPFTVTFRDLPTKVIALKGSWQNTSPIEIYGEALNDNPRTGGGVSRATPAEFVGHLGDWIHQQVITDATDPGQKISWHDNDSLVNDADRRAAHDKTLVLTHLTEQTALTWSEETRTLRHLFIESPSTP